MAAIPRVKKQKAICSNMFSGRIVSLTLSRSRTTFVIASYYYSNPEGNAVLWFQSNGLCEDSIRFFVPLN